jgi:hypothetical protein
MLAADTSELITFRGRHKIAYKCKLTFMFFNNTADYNHNNPRSSQHYAKSKFLSLHTDISDFDLNHVY